MSSLSWNVPFRVITPNNGHQTVHGPFAALILLMDDWPDMRGSAYLEARSACRAALEGRRDVEEARARFMLAAREADMMNP